MWLLHGLFGPSRLACAREGLQHMVDLNQSRQITAEAIAEKARDTPDDGSRHLNQLQGTLKRPRAYKSCQNQAKLGGETDPDPLSSIFAELCALAGRADLLGMLAPDEAPHLVELHLGDRKVPQQVCVDLMGLLSGSPQPLQNGFFGHAQNKADVTKRDFDQQHLQGHYDLLFRRPQVKEDGVACLREGALTLAAAEDTPLATLGHIGGNSANVASVHQPIMGTVRIGARLAPVLGFSHRPNLPSCSGVIHTDRKFGLFSFSKYYRMSTGHATNGYILTFDLTHPLVGFDHGVGHSLLVLCDAKVPHGKKWNDFKTLENYLFIVSISL